MLGSRQMDKGMEKKDNQIRYFLPSDVVLHNKPNDIWVSFLGKVCDITPLVKEFKGKKEVKPLLAYAGKDISHWFDKRTEDIKYYIHPVTKLKAPYCPHGLIPHVSPPIPTSTWQPLEAVRRPYDGLPWWRDKKYLVGYLSSNPRPLKIISCGSPHLLKRSLFWVASEEKLSDILQRISPPNPNFPNFSMKYKGEKMKLDRTLEENQILDERKIFSQLGMPENTYIPGIQLYFYSDYAA